MSVRINNFGGYATWLFRKYCSNMTSAISLSAVAMLREKRIKKYIDIFYEAEEIPMFKFLMIETVNRCNGKCSFCPANVRDEKREFKKMSTDLFDRIVEQLQEIQWTGSIFLQVNNEPFIDGRMIDFASRVRKKLPKCNICLITNGTLLNKEKMEQLIGLVDSLIINDYSERYRLNDNIKQIYSFVKKNKKMFAEMEVVINRRYSAEILATRAGSAPNKNKKNNKVTEACIYPFTDFIIFPNGNVGMCCNDCFETTSFGNVQEERIDKIWRNDNFTELRDIMRKGNREKYPFCSQCDVVDAGSREKVIAQK